MQSTGVSHTGRRWFWGFIVVGAVVGGSFAFLRGPAAAESTSHPHAPKVGSASAVSVEVTSPRPGGIERVCLQPGSVEPFESADLYSKVSGYLVEQKVDIGYRVNAGDVLARLAVPEYEKQVDQDRADVVRAEARVEQMKAAIDTAEADLGAATSAVALAQADKKSKESHRAFREKQRDRIRGLVARNAIDAKLVDEQEDHYQSAVASELGAEEAITAARQKENAAHARVKQSQADLKYAEAEVATAKARLEKSQVLLDYTTIRSPYTGVVTKRNFHPGDFVRSADAGGDRIPLLAVERTDIMRFVVQVPERDVPLVDCGDPAVVEVDALPGVRFATDGEDHVEVSRLAASEDPHTRMMRTEVHVKNPDGKLRRGMFGRVAIVLQPGLADSFRLPSMALSGKADGGRGTVRVVRDDKVALAPVHYGADNGSEVEILSGLNAGDRVILRANGSIQEGTPVTVAEPVSRASAH
jgi:RND family efflux transporter MFP subunit